MKNKLMLIGVLMLLFPLVGMTCDNTKKVSTSTATPSIVSITPNKGPETGGTTVTILGTNFDLTSTTVTIGGNPATDVSVSIKSFTGLFELTCKTPVFSGVSRIQDVVVTTPQGPATLVGGFTYPNPPTVTGITPDTGSTEGGTTATITGDFFESGSTTVTIGGNPATSVNVTSSTQLTCRIPGGIASTTATVVVTTPWGSGTLAPLFTYYNPPDISLNSIPQSTLPADIIDKNNAYISLPLRSELTFEIRVDPPSTGAPSSQMNLVLLNPPPGAIFRPAKNATVPITFQWDIQIGGIHQLFFESRYTSFSHIKKIYKVTVSVQGNKGHFGVLTGDVTGDGVLDVLGGAQESDANSITNSGAIYVWKGSTSPSATPTATLTVPFATANDALGNSPSIQGIYLENTIGDSALDIIALATNADTNNKTDTGAIYIWQGGSSLVGNRNPDYTLVVSGAAAGDKLGYMGDNLSGGRSFHIVDIDGDGDRDLIVGASKVDLNGKVDVGAIYIWKNNGGTFTTNPTYTLSVPDANSTASDQLGWEQGIRIAKVTSSTTCDIICGSRLVDVKVGTPSTTIVDAGAIYIWKNDSGTFTTNPTYTLTTAKGTSNPYANDQLGFAGDSTVAGKPNIFITDLAGKRAIVALAGMANIDITTPSADTIVDAGAVYIWYGDSLGTSQEYSQRLTLENSTKKPVTADMLGFTGSSLPSIRFKDLNGDGSTDIIVGATKADIEIDITTPSPGTQTIADAGAIYVWYQTSTSPFFGATFDRRLVVVNENNKERTGLTKGYCGFMSGNVTGTNTVDIVAEANETNVSITSGSPPTTSTITKAGAIYVWKGISIGTPPLPSTTSAVYPDFDLHLSDPVIEDQLGFVQNGRGLFLKDLDNDSILDIIVGSSLSDLKVTTPSPSTTVDVGGIYIWMGALSISTADPDFTLRVNIPTAGDKLGYTDGVGGLQIVDIDGNGPSIIAGASKADLNSKIDVGAIYIWPNSSLTGTPPAVIKPNCILSVAGTNTADNDGLLSQGYTFFIADVNNDEKFDILAGTSLADVGPNPVPDRGAIYFWDGSLGFTSNRTPDGTLYNTSAIADDQLGGGTTVGGIRLGDIDGDGIPDLLIGTPMANISTITDSGAIYFWKGSGIAGAVNPDVTFSAFNPTPGDKLGN